MLLKKPSASQLAWSIWLPSMKTFTHIYSRALTACMMKCLTCIFFFFSWNHSVKVDWNGIGFYFRSWTKSCNQNLPLPVCSLVWACLCFSHQELSVTVLCLPEDSEPVLVVFMFNTTQNHFVVDLMPALEDHQCSVWKCCRVEEGT